MKNILTLLVLLQILFITDIYTQGQSILIYDPYGVSDSFQSSFSILSNDSVITTDTIDNSIHSYDALFLFLGYPYTINQEEGNHLKSFLQNQKPIYLYTDLLTAQTDSVDFWNFIGLDFYAAGLAVVEVDSVTGVNSEFTNGVSIDTSFTSPDVPFAQGNLITILVGQSNFLDIDIAYISSNEDIKIIVDQFFQIHHLEFLETTIEYFGLNEPTDTLYITVISPNGGEYWEIGKTYQVQWISENVDFVKLFITTDNGSSWELFAENVPASDGLFDFDVPIIVSEECKIKIIDESNSLLYDESDSLFSIGSEPVADITVISPNGGENWYIGETHNIIWTSKNVENVRIDLSSWNGLWWTNIVDSISSIGIYSLFMIPEYQSFESRIQITDLNDTTIFDISDTVFAIRGVLSAEDELDLPTIHELGQNYPNPFNPTTKIEFRVADLSAGRQGFTFVSLKVYDVLGNEIAILVNEEKPTGNYEVEFDASNLTSGVYFYRLQASIYVETKKMTLIK